MIKKYLHGHLYYYLVFGLMQVIGFSVLLALSGHREIQIAVIVISTFCYAGWAILHHYLEHSLSLKIVLEYVVFGIFGIVVSIFYFN